MLNQMEWKPIESDELENIILPFFLRKLSLGWNVLFKYKLVIRSNALSLHIPLVQEILKLPPSVGLHLLPLDRKKS
jgi:hypothetical protein